MPCQQRAVSEMQSGPDEGTVSVRRVDGLSAIPLAEAREWRVVSRALPRVAVTAVLPRGRAVQPRMVPRPWEKGHPLVVAAEPRLSRAMPGVLLLGRPAGVLWVGAGRSEGHARSWFLSPTPPSPAGGSGVWRICDGVE